jgi:NAD(P)-dependent dehydrogenase (short-subunit alcohol dehydrogenase family)
MKQAIVIGASGGIGAALAEALAEEDVPVRGFARSFTGADHLDLTDAASIAAAAATVTGTPDLIVVTTGLLHEGERGPEKSMAALDADWLMRQYAINAVGPALVARHFLPLMPKAGRCVFAVLSARVGSIGDNKLGGWYGYRMAKAALNQFVRTAAIEDKRRNDRGIVVGLHPGTVDTGLSQPFQAHVRADQLFTPARAAVQLLDVIEGLKAPDSGRVFDWEGKEITP